MRYKVLGKEFKTSAEAKHYLEVGIRLERDKKKIAYYKKLLKELDV
jgi:hypothetical protein